MGVPAKVDRIAEAAAVLRELGATEVYVFGSVATGKQRPDSDLDMAVTGIPPARYFTAASRASEAAGREVDLVDLDDETPMVRFLKGSGDLVRVG